MCSQAILIRKIIHIIALLLSRVCLSETMIFLKIFNELVNILNTAEKKHFNINF